MRIAILPGIVALLIQLAFAGVLEKAGELHPPYGNFTPQSPIALTASPAGRLYMLDARLAVVIELTTGGQAVRQIGGPGSGVEQFSDPADICALSGLDVFIADRGNDRIIRLDRELTYLAEFKSLEGTSYDLSFENPKSVLLSPRGDLFIADGSNDRILKIDPTGRPVFSFGEYGQSGGSLLDLCRLELDPKGGLWILDLEGSVTRFDEYGGYLIQIQSEIAGNATGLAVSEQAVWVCSDSLLWSFDRSTRQGEAFTPARLSVTPGVTLIDLTYRGELLWLLDSEGTIHRFKVIAPR